MFSERFGVSYHSKYGAWRETQHVFIEAGLRYAAVDRQRVGVLEIGFGTGLNAVASLLHASAHGLALDYLGAEAYPLPERTLRALDHPAALAWDAAQRELWEWLVELPWSSEGRLSSKPGTELSVGKLLGRFEDLDERDRFDVVYYDAFSPEAQPELWTPEMFARTRRALRPGGVFVTYCAKGQVKRDLRAVGFEVERLAGPPGKREMTRATKK